MADLNLEHGLEVLDGRTKWVGWLIIAFVVATLGAVAGQFGELTGSIDLDAPGESSVLMMVVSVVYLTYAMVFVATIVLVAMWIFRAHANVRAAGAGPLEVSPGWAVGWFFVPIANLFKPFQAMRELWNASHALTDGFTQNSDLRLKLWWGFWIASNIITNIGARAMFTAPAGQTTTSVFDVIGGLLSIPAAWFLWQIVREVNSAQRSTLAAASTFS